MSYRLIRNDDNQTVLGDADTLESAQAQLPAIEAVGAGEWHKLSAVLWTFQSLDGAQHLYFVEATGAHRVAIEAAALDPSAASFAVVTPSALATELQTDPNAYGYAAMIVAGNDQGLTDALNLVRDGTNAGPAITVFRNDIKANEVRNAVREADFVALTAAAREWFDDIEAETIIDATQANLRADILALFPTGSNTRTNLTAVAQRTGSRAEQLFGVGTVLSVDDIATALGRPPRLNR